jgi:3-hydroxymyristoyl/3-hydroxydecanoyl-(acyl carrier protein) dehydratase
MTLAPDARWVDVTIPLDHPSFAGHFPLAPVLPGVVLASLVMEAIAQDADLAGRLGPCPRIDELKFLAPVGPGAALRIGLTARVHGVGFEIRRGATAVARGRLSATTPA